MNNRFHEKKRHKNIRRCKKEDEEEKRANVVRVCNLENLRTEHVE